MRKSDFIYLAKCGADGTAPVLFDCDEETQLLILKKAQELMVGAVIASAIEKSNCATDKVLKECKQIKTNSLRREMIFEARREEVFSRLEKSGIWYMPLKGCVLKDFYPEYGMREMSDADVLFDKSHRRQVKDIMLSLGYNVVDYGDYIHDVYQKEPILDFEMHISLFDVEIGDEIIGYYQNIEEKLIKNGYEYKFSDEDLYIYIVLHIYRHVRISDIGIKALLDLYLILKAKGDTLCWEYIEKQFEIMNVSDFEHKIRGLIKKLFFDNLELTEDEKVFANQFLDYGAYGNAKRIVEKSFKNLGADTSRTRLIMYRLFRDKKWWNAVSPITQKYPFLIPFLQVKRIFRGVFVTTKKTVVELKQIYKH